MHLQQSPSRQFGPVALSRPGRQLIPWPAAHLRLVPSVRRGKSGSQRWKLPRLHGLPTCAGALQLLFSKRRSPSSARAAHRPLRQKYFGLKLAYFALLHFPKLFFEHLLEYVWCFSRGPMSEKIFEPSVANKCAAARMHRAVQLHQRSPKRHMRQGSRGGAENFDLAGLALDSNWGQALELEETPALVAARPVHEHPARRPPRVVHALGRRPLH
mmetsp:Transcript_5133/g.12023  ORF Transcript_5133/g.12023 Transcript_5133/m.12023 type:complete len:214 (+) Transcript_5133:1585-2226(+)